MHEWDVWYHPESWPKERLSEYVGTFEAKSTPEAASIGLHTIRTSCTDRLEDMIPLNVHRLKGAPPLHEFSCEYGRVTVQRAWARIGRGGL
jgi:hypothetical protein